MPPTTTSTSFIEAQFPVSKVSKESYKERKANHSQTLTGLGKWWGRKPLVMIRAALIGLLMPSSDDMKRDREIFLKIMTMDEDGMWQRMQAADKNIRYKDAFNLLTADEREHFFDLDAVNRGKAIHHCIIADGRDEKEARKEEIQRLAFGRLSYDEKLDYVERPEQIDGPSEEAWEEINDHLGTRASTLVELVEELGQQRFGHTPRVGDAFCGGGSVPFEAARLGCKAFGSDLNPVAALLTWASLNIVGGGEEVAEQVREAQEAVYAAVDEQVTKWGIEHKTEGPNPGREVIDSDTGEVLGRQVGHWRADAFLYCVETECPECGVMVPLAPSWKIGGRTHTIARLILDEDNQRFDIEIEEGVSSEELEAADNAGTVRNNEVYCPACEKSTPIQAVRGDRKTDNGRQSGLRMWEADDIVPRPGDTFQERLYCVRWEETYEDDEDGDRGTQRHYRSVSEHDVQREEKALDLLQERFDEWQTHGFIPYREIERGIKTTELTRSRGWSMWHHLFNPRQMLVLGSFLSHLPIASSSQVGVVANLLGVGRQADYNSKLSPWSATKGKELVNQAFANQAVNPLYSFGSRGLSALASSFFLSLDSFDISGTSSIEPADAREVSDTQDIWVTDPPYANAVSYHELSEFFISWYENTINSTFPGWYTDSKRVLAVKGGKKSFINAMRDCYHNLTESMNTSGLQVVMFTHQDSSVWADLARILAASGLCVESAWTITTETDSSRREGNYVQGTVLLVLRKRLQDRTAYSDEITVQVEDEVTRQLDVMQSLDEDEDEPSFGDTDYQLAAYAAALRVLTQYSTIDGESWQDALNRTSGDSASSSRTSSIEGVIDDAVEIACNHLIPRGFKEFIWKTLEPEERLYLKGLELESHGEYRTGVYQELARGFGVRHYKVLYASSQANRSRFKAPSEFESRTLGDNGFAGSLVRHALFAVYEARGADDARKGLNWLKTEVRAYWQHRKYLLEILRYLSRLGDNDNMAGVWDADAKYARRVAGAVENDHA